MAAAELNIKDKAEKHTIKVAPFKKEIRTTLAHKHNNYLEIIYLSKGSGYHTIDSDIYQIESPVLFIVRKEQVHHWKIETEPDGFVLLLKKAFVDASIDKALKELLTKISAISHINIINTKFIEQVFQLLVDEVSVNDKFTISIVEGLLKSLLSKILQESKFETITRDSKDNLFQDFREILSKDKLLKNNISYYAGLLKTTPQNLNAICRKFANQSATGILSEFIINEAKRLLIYTDMSVSEIALQLDFHDGSHFVKYFKKHVELTPNAYRTSV